MQSLSDLCGQFIVNYHINNIDCIKIKLLNMLVTAKGALKGSRDMALIVEETTYTNRKSTWKKKPMKKQKTESKPKRKVPKKKVTNKGKEFLL